MDYFGQCSYLETNPRVLFLYTISVTLVEAVTATEFGNL